MRSIARVARVSLVMAALAAAALRRRPDWDLGGYSLSSVLGFVVLGGVALRLAACLRAGRGGRAAVTAILLLEGALYLFHLGRLALVVHCAVACLELSLLAYVILSAARGEREPGVLLEDRLGEALAVVAPPSVARVVAVELVVLAAAVLAPFRRARGVAGSFGYAETTVWRSLLPVLPILLAVDWFTVTALLPRGAVLAHAVSTFLTLYSGVWCFGTYALLRDRPHRLAGSWLYLHQGIRRSVRVPLADIEAVRVLGDDAPAGNALRLDVSGARRWELRLRAPVRAMGLLGPLPESSLIVSSADDPAALCRAVHEGARVRT